MSAKPKRAAPAPITGEVVGEATRLSCLARFLLPHLRPPELRLVPKKNDDERTVDHETQGR